MADMLGTERLTSTYGISLFVSFSIIEKILSNYFLNFPINQVNGILQLIGPPICGIVFEAMNVYGPLFNILGFFLIFGSTLGCCLPIIKRKQKLKEDQMQIETAEKLLA